MSNLGIGAMLGFLGGNEETVNAILSSINKEISFSVLDEGEDKLRIGLEDGSTLVLFDDGQSCCESRYMRTDDDLSYFVGAKLLNIAIKSAANKEHEWGTHEIQFLEVTTSKGVFQIANHNEHNGYYGGFWIVARLLNSTPNVQVSDTTDDDSSTTPD
jgi:hypothetical protein